MTDRPETRNANEETPVPPCSPSARRRVRTSHLVLGGAAALVAIAAVVGGLRAADEMATGFQTIGWRGGWHHGSDRAGPIGRICDDSRDAWLADRIELIEEFVTFTPAQQPAWQELTQAVDAASTKVGAACEQVETAELPATAPARLERAELLLATGLDVVKGIRPAVDGFYATLEPEQRAALDRLASRRGRDD